ncbi:MAG: DUF1512 domain-containing protein [Candidatus Bathyarchaeota archaeon]|uniref:DUF1512 domain-containing protein n=1 Tax=Candidatus Bathycorpusculum sp. TaxID=2994959 RepID=UPI002837692F|nr:DUF1512 domain-containing protein [Candidatus Termiticorpusculum sp.]MCL2257014.1 DUF1512 domain-containing protein [Candidatus Termiticorpusculum sp.]MCL2292861.1 DUF1512 domain-containing protein [Candidatus Termiticorpusculum sp.]
MSLIPVSDIVSQVSTKVNIHSNQFFGFGGDVGWQAILQLFTVGFFFVIMFYGQRLQMRVMMKDVEGSLLKLKNIKDEGRKNAIDTLKEVGKSTVDIAPRVDRCLDYFTISPQGMDPAGIVDKLDHILDVRDQRIKDDVKIIAPQCEGTQLNNMENTLEAAMALNYIYKIVRHYYIQSKKTMSLYVVMQLQMILPIVMKEAEAYSAALKAFSLGQPIGDSVGPLIASKLMLGQEIRKVHKDCVVASVPFEGRTALIMKAEGPGGNVGKPGDAIETIIEENEGKIAMLIMIDAGLKLEGENVGDVSEGIGSAIGGPGVDAFKIEEKLVKYKIPINAIIIKEDIGDAVSPMRKEIHNAADKAIERVRELVVERTKEGDTVIIFGVGNSIGVGQ